MKCCNVTNERIFVVDCRDGMVVSLVESSERHVMRKLSRRLGVTIPELGIKGGVIEPLESTDTVNDSVAASSA